MARLITLFVAAIGSIAFFGLVQVSALAQIPAGFLPGALTTNGDALPPGVRRGVNLETATVQFEN